MNNQSRPPIRVLVTPVDLEYQGTDSFDRHTWKHKMTGKFYCTVDLRSKLDDVLNGKAGLYVKEGTSDLDGEPSYEVKLSPSPAISLHAALLENGIECNNQMGNNDLFVADTPEARAIIALYPQHERNISTFVDNVSKQPSIEVPFAFERDRKK